MDLKQILHDLADGKRGAELHDAIEALAPVLETIVPGGPIVAEVAEAAVAAVEAAEKTPTAS